MRGYSDSTLMHMTKSDLLRQLRIAESNEQAAKTMLNQQYENVKDWQPVRHGHWELVAKGSFTCIYRCSNCGMCCIEMDIIRAHYCSNCGAKMDEEDK